MRRDRQVGKTAMQKTTMKTAIRTRVARHEIREELERRILPGETKPGERLSQQSLARELGVTQGTVRESLLELQWLGPVESIDRLGVFVDKLDVSRISEGYQLREVFEGLAVRLACHNAGRADLAELRKMADEVYRLAQDDNTETARSTENFTFASLSSRAITRWCVSRRVIERWA